jgi:hypothetical protein
MGGRNARGDEQRGARSDVEEDRADDPRLPLRVAAPRRGEDVADGVQVSVSRGIR